MGFTTLKSVGNISNRNILMAIIPNVSGSANLLFTKTKVAGSVVQNL